jgi:hypothetical protein
MKMMGFSPYRSLPLSYSQNFAYAHLYVYLQQLQSRLYFIGSGMFFFLKFVENRLKKNKARIRNVVTTIGMATGCQCMSDSITAQHSSVARVFRKIFSRSSLGNGLYSASCRRNGNGCCQGDLPSFRSQGHIQYYHAAASHAT